VLCTINTVLQPFRWRIEADLVAAFTRRAQDITNYCTNPLGRWLHHRRMRFVQYFVMLKHRHTNNRRSRLRLTSNRCRSDELSSYPCTSRGRTASTWRGFFREVRSGEAAAGTEQHTVHGVEARGRVYARWRSVRYHCSSPARCLRFWFVASGVTGG
jgi:hypothetical protein